MVYHLGMVRFVDDFKFVQEALGLNAVELCQKIGLSRAYIAEIISGKTQPSKRTLEAFYSYAYRSGLRINLSREQLLHELNPYPVLYHGSKYGLGDIRPSGSRPNCDFGNGFYLGKTYQQAANFMADTEEGTVYAFSFRGSGLKEAALTCDINWLLLVCAFRGKLDNYKDHPLLKTAFSLVEGADYIRAPIADNKMFQIMRSFEDGEITDVESLHALSASDLGEKYVMKTEKAISCLKKLDRLYLSEPEKQALTEEAMERAKMVDTKLKMAKREFRGKGKYIEELFQ